MVLVSKKKFIVILIICIFTVFVLTMFFPIISHNIEKMECETKGGIMISHGGPSGAACALPTTDVGTECSDSSQCRGFCDAKPDAINVSNYTGSCSKYDRTYSCFNHVRNGTVIARMCY